MHAEIETIQREVAKAFDVPMDAMISARRGRDFARPRQVAMYLAKKLIPAASLPTIGREFGRDHTTIMYAVDAVEQRRMTDQSLDKQLRGLSISIAKKIKQPGRIRPLVEIAAENLANELARHAHRGLLALARRNPEFFVKNVLRRLGAGGPGGAA